LLGWVDYTGKGVVCQAKKRAKKTTRYGARLVQGNFFDSFDYLYVILEVNSIDGMVLFAGDAIPSRAMMDEMIQDGLEIFYGRLAPTIHSIKYPNRPH
jgi:hypothetical protein